MQSIEPLAYRPAEAAAVLGVSRSALYELLQQCAIRSIKAGGMRLIPRSELEEWLARQLKKEGYTAP